MAKNTLPVDFKDDIMNNAMGGKRRYRVINNSDGTISLEDATTYDQVGSNFGAGQMNATNEAVNAAADAGKIIDDIEVIRNVTKEGYVAGALALKQVDNSLDDYELVGEINSLNGQLSIDRSKYKRLFIQLNQSQIGILNSHEIPNRINGGYSTGRFNASYYRSTSFYVTCGVVLTDTYLILDQIDAAGYESSLVRVLVYAK